MKEEFSFKKSPKDLFLISVLIGIILGGGFIMCLYNFFNIIHPSWVGVFTISGGFLMLVILYSRLGGRGR